MWRIITKRSRTINLSFMLAGRAKNGHKRSVSKEHEEKDHIKAHSEA